MKLKGQVAFVTGAASGIGRSIAESFAREGALVVIADLNAEGAKHAASEISAKGGEALSVKVDVSDSRQVQEAVVACLEGFNTVDILVNNAGIQHVAPIVELSEEKWRQLIDVHLTGAFLCAKAVLPAMIKKRYGRIINIASIHGKEASAFKAPYVAAKHGLLGLTKVLALEGADYGITANAICPGYVRTPLVEKQLPSLAAQYHLSEQEVLEEVVLKNVPQKRLLEPQEVAALACYLASAEAAGITGQAINISGGWGMH